MKKTSLSFFSLLLSASLYAQESDANASRKTLEEIAVQGARLPASPILQSDLLKADEIELREVRSLGDLSGLSPNLHLNGNGIKSFGDVLIMRGIGNTQFFGAPGVQMYVDGVPQGNAFSYGADLYDLESVEILRGAQGHASGKLSPGGAVNLITRKPGDTQRSKVSASYGSFDTQRYGLGSSGPLGNDSSYSVSAQHSLSDGFLNNTAGRDNDSESWNGRLAFHWDGGAGTRASLALSFTTHELGAQPIVLRNQADFYARASDMDEYTEIDQDQQSLSVEHDLAGGKLVSITARSDWDMNPNLLDLDLSLFPAATSSIEQDQSIWSQELRIENNEDPDMGWNLGLFYADEEVEGKATRFFLTGLTPPFPTSDTQVTSYVLETENLAVFGSFYKALSDQDVVSLGMRYDDFENSIVRNKTSQLAAPVALNKESDSGIFSPSLAWERTVSETLKVGAGISFSGKRNGFSAFSDADANASYGKEEITSFDLGFTYRPSENWTLAVTGFLNDVDDYQLELPAANTDYMVVNVDEVSVYGIEVESTHRIDGGWTVSLGYGLSNSEIEDVTSLSAGASALANLKGRQVSFVPHHTLSASVSQQLDNGAYYQLGTRTIGETFYWDQSGVNTTDVIDAYTLLDAKIGMVHDGWQVEVFGTNLTDEEYYTSLVSSLTSLGAAPGVAGSPRVIGLSVSREF